MKVAELKKYLDQRFIKYPKNAKKPYLQKLFDSLKTVEDLNPKKRKTVVDNYVYVAPQESEGYDEKEPTGEYYTDKKGVTRVGIPEMPVTFNVPRIMTKEEEEALPFYLAREKRLKEEEEFLRQVETRALRKNITPQQAKSQLHQLEVNMTHHPIEDPVREWRVKGPMTPFNEFKQEDELEDRALMEATKIDIENEGTGQAEKGYDRERRLAKKVLTVLEERQQAKRDAFGKVKQAATSRSLLLKPDKTFKLAPLTFIDEPDESPITPVPKTPRPRSLSSPPVPPETPKTPKSKTVETQTDFSPVSREFRAVVAPDKKEAAIFQDDLAEELKRKQEFKKEMAVLEAQKQQILVSSEITPEEKAKLLKEARRKEEARIASEAKATEEAKKKAAQKAEEDRRKKLQQKTETKVSNQEQEAEVQFKEKERAERKKESAVIDKDKAALDARINALFGDNEDAMEEVLKQKDEQLEKIRKSILLRELAVKTLIKTNKEVFSKAFEKLKAKKEESKNPKAVEKEIATLVEDQKQKVEDTQEALDKLKEEREKVKQEKSAQKKKKAEEEAKEKEARKKAINTLKAEEAKKALPELERLAEEEKARVIAEVLEFERDYLVQQKLAEELKKRGIVEEPPPPPPPPPKKKKQSKGEKYAQETLNQIDETIKTDKNFAELAKESGFKEAFEANLKAKGKLTVELVDEAYDEAGKKFVEKAQEKVLSRATKLGQKSILKKGFEKLKDQVKKKKLEELETEAESLLDVVRKSEKASALRKSQDTTRKSKDITSQDAQELLDAISASEQRIKKRPEPSKKLPVISEDEAKKQKASKDITKFVSAVAKGKQLQKQKEKEKAEASERDEKIARDRALEIEDQKQKNKEGLEKAQEYIDAIEASTNETIKALVPSFKKKFYGRLKENEGNLSPDFVTGIFKDLQGTMTMQSDQRKALLKAAEIVDRPVLKKGFEKLKENSKEAKKDKIAKHNAGLDRYAEILTKFEDAGRYDSAVKAMQPEFEKKFKAAIKLKGRNLTPEYVDKVFDDLLVEIDKKVKQRDALTNIVERPSVSRAFEKLKKNAIEGIQQDNRKYILSQLERAAEIAQEAPLRQALKKNFDKLKEQTKKATEAQKVLETEQENDAGIKTGQAALRALRERAKGDPALASIIIKTNFRPKFKQLLGENKGKLTPELVNTIFSDLYDKMMETGKKISGLLRAEEIVDKPVLRKAFEKLKPKGSKLPVKEVDPIVLAEEKRQVAEAKRKAKKDKQEKQLRDYLESEAKKQAIIDDIALNEKMRAEYKAYYEEKKRREAEAASAKPVLKRNKSQEKESNLKEQAIREELSESASKRALKEEKKREKEVGRVEALRLEKERSKQERIAKAKANPEELREMNKAAFEKAKKEKELIEAAYEKARQKQREKRRLEKERIELETLARISAEKEKEKEEETKKVEKELTKKEKEQKALEEEIAKITEEQKRRRIANYKAKVQAKKEEKAMEEAFRAQQRQAEREQKKANKERLRREAEKDREEDKEQRKKWAEEASKEFLEKRNEKWLRTREKELADAIAKDEELERKGLKKRTIRERTELLRQQKAVEDELTRQKKAKAMKEGLIKLAEKKKEEDRQKQIEEKTRIKAERQKANAERVRQEEEERKKRRGKKDEEYPDPTTPKTPISPAVRRKEPEPEPIDIATELKAFMKLVPMKYKMRSLDNEVINEDNPDVPLLQMFVEAMKSNRIKEATRIADLAHLFWEKDKGKGIKFRL